MINVFITDGNRRVNWDYSPETTVKQILDHWRFEPVADSVSINGDKISDEELNREIVTFSPMLKHANGSSYLRLRIGLRSVRRERTKKQTENTVEDEDVR